MVALITVGVLLVLYSSVEVLLYTKAMKYSALKVKEQIKVTISDDQAKLIWFAFNGDKNYRTTYQIIGSDIINQKNNQIQIIAAYKQVMSTNDYMKWNELDFQIRLYSTIRYINTHINWKDCIEFIISNNDFGRSGARDLNQAAQDYFKKSVSELGDYELLSLCILIKGSRLYSIGSERSKNKVESIIENYYRS